MCLNLSMGHRAATITRAFASHPVLTPLSPSTYHPAVCAKLQFSQMYQSKYSRSSTTRLTRLPLRWVPPPALSQSPSFPRPVPSTSATRECPACQLPILAVGIYQWRFQILHPACLHHADQNHIHADIVFGDQAAIGEGKGVIDDRRAGRFGMKALSLKAVRRVVRVASEFSG